MNNGLPQRPRATPTPPQRGGDAAARSWPSGAVRRPQTPDRPVQRGVSSLRGKMPPSVDTAAVSKGDEGGEAAPRPARPGCPRAPRVSPVNVSAGRGAASRGLELLTGRPLRLPPPRVPSRPSPCPFLKTPVGQVPTATAQPYRGFDASWLLELEALIRNPCDGGKPQLALSLCNLL